MRFKLLRIAIVLAALFSLSLQESFAQGALNDASVEFGSRTYEPLSSYMISYGPYNSYGSTFVSSLAFPFSYDNVTYDYFQMHGCGTLQFRPSYSYYYIYAYYYYTTYYIYDYYYTNTGKIFAYYASMDSYPYYATGGYMRYGVQGSSPNRVMVFDWSHFHYYYSYYFSSSDFNFQVRLYEQDYEAEIHYGQMTRGRNIGVYENYYGYGEAMIGFTGKINDINDKWINVDPGGNGSGGHGSWEYWKAPNVAGGGYPGSRGVGNRNTVNNNDAFDAIQNGDYVRLTFGAKIEGQWPLKDSNLIREYVYGNNTTDPYGHGDDQRPAIWISKLKSPTTNVHRQIHGPLSFPPSPYYKVIYDATQDIPNDVKTNFTIPTPGAASNPAFMTDPAHLGALDLTNTDQIKGGLYRVDDNFSDGGKDYEKFYTFNIALNTDLELTKVLDPKRREDKKYPLTSRVPVRILVTNRGLNLATKFYAVAYIYSKDGDQLWKDSVYWKAGPGQALKLGDNIVIDFNSFRPLNVADYEFKVKISYIGDEESTNNTIPWAGQGKYWFRVAPEIEAQALAVLKPSNVDEQGNPDNIYVGRPIQPKARFQNNGITDISDAKATMTIHLKGDDNYEWEDVQTVEVIPQGIVNNKADWLFDFFTPPVPGTYYACVTIDALDDDFVENNTVCDTFEVVHALAGTYTIGPNKGDSAYDAKNFVSLQEAVNALYLKGVTGPVEFQFTAPTYNVGDIAMANEEPALDLRSQILGVDSKNTVTFKASPAMATTEGSVTINLYSGVGVGILFGQSPLPFNSNAVVNNVPSSFQKNYANSAGYLSFDGGKQRSLRFVMHTPVKLCAPFFLSQGASHIQINNCIITNSDPATAWTNYKLPLTKYLSPQFEFEPDNRSVGTESYSAGIVLRSIPPRNIMTWAPNPTNPAQAINTYNLDTLTNSHNNIYNNDISGFAYGVVSLGIGPLSRDGVMKRFYNSDNTVSKNLIYNVSRAGVFFGHEESSVIKNNKIFGVASTTTGHNEGTNVAGIMVGGDAKTNFLGYNNINIDINGNEISNVGKAVDDANHNYIYGIKVEECKNDYQGTSFPDVPENTLIKNNIVWGLYSGVADANRCGIRVFTQRNTDAGSWDNIMITPLAPTYFTRGDKIVNNTILVADDGYNTTGAVAGLTAQSSYGTVIKNNAIAMLDNNSAGANNTYAAVVYQGILPSKEGGVESDRNVFWLMPASAATDSAAVYRFIETDGDGSLIYLGERTEFLTMNQWQMYTGEDYFSTMRNFTVNLTNPDATDKLSTLRINNVPTWPVGSVLNNRGDVLDYVTYDIDGNARGTSGQRYDIGAVEFPGILLNSDVEISTVQQPGSYRATTTVFSDAEHVMTTAPVEVKAQLRNNGSLDQTGVDVTVNVYRENPAGGYFADPELTKTIKVDIPSSESEEVAFNLANGDNDDWYPMTYGDWNNWYRYNNDPADQAYTVPDWYGTMENNVTPKYKIEIKVQADEYVANNLYSKVVRFYLKRSSLNLLVSGENTYVDLVPGVTADQAAGRRNFDSLNVNINRIGWWDRWYYDGIDTVLNQSYDVFERNAWEPRAVDYTMYTSLIWSDGDDKALTREQRADITNFVESGTPDLKKNLVVSSQEMARSNYAAAKSWVNSILDAKIENGYPTGPNGAGTWYAGDANPAINITNPERFIVGESVGRLLQNMLLNTNLTPSDPAPIPALVSVYADGEGLSRPSHIYNHDALVAMPDPLTDAFGVATTTLNSNRIYLGADWRHYGDGESILRSTLDFLAKNGGEIIPVELLSFNAKTVANRVNVFWETASEVNSDKFEVQKADFTNSGAANFVTIAEEKAAGKSSKHISYSVTDADVKSGNSYVYRLKMVDLDGSYNYSDEVVVNVGGDNNAWLSEATPNPAEFKATTKLTVPEAGYVEVLIYDMTGNMVKKAFTGNVNAGVNEIELNVSDLASGIYTYAVNIDGKMLTRQIRIVR